MKHGVREDICIMYPKSVLLTSIKNAET